MTSHPVVKLLLCFGAKHQDVRLMLFGFFVILTHRLTELCILNAEKLRRYIAGLSRKCHDQTKKIEYYFNDKYHAAAGNVMASLAMFQNDCS